MSDRNGQPATIGTPFWLVWNPDGGPRRTSMRAKIARRWRPRDWRASIRVKHSLFWKACARAVWTTCCELICGLECDLWMCRTDKLAPVCGQPDDHHRH